MFRGQRYEFDQNSGWWIRYPETSSGVAYQFSQQLGLIWRHAFPTEATKATFAAYNYQAKVKHHEKAWLNNGSIVYRDLGDDFYTRRLSFGWQGVADKDALQEIKEFADLLAYFWPHQVRFSSDACIKLSDIVVSNTDTVLSADWKNAVVGEGKVMKLFPSRDAYLQYIHLCLQKSWEDFLNKHGAEIDQIQAFREIHYGVSHFDQPDRVIIWEEFATV